MDCNLLGFSIRGILQARTLEWIAISFSRGSSWPRDRTHVSHIEGRRFHLWATRKGSLLMLLLLLSDHVRHIVQVIQQNNITPVYLQLWTTLYRLYKISHSIRNLSGSISCFLNQLCTFYVIHKMTYTCESVITWNKSVLFYNKLPNLEGDCVCGKYFSRRLARREQKYHFWKLKLQLETKLIGKPDIQYSLLVWLWVLLWDWGSPGDACFLSLHVVKNKSG